MKLVEFCKEGKHVEAMDELYHPDIVSVEAGEGPVDLEALAVDGLVPGGASERSSLREAMRREPRHWRLKRLISISA